MSTPGIGEVEFLGLSGKLEPLCAEGGIVRAWNAGRETATVNTQPQNEEIKPASRVPVANGECISVNPT